MNSKAILYYEAKRNTLPNANLRRHPRVPFSEIDLKSIKMVHIIAVCGTAMASLADLLIQQGYTVTGSDSAFYPPMGEVIDALGIEKKSFDIDNIAGADIVIVGNMCPVMNIEVAYCRDNNIPYFSIGEVISRLCIRDKKSIVIAGTHGKTTTTGFAIRMLSKLAKNESDFPSYLVGGVIKDSGKSAVYNPDSDFFVIEGDEYDTAYFDKAPKFLHYKPYFAVITSIELDHIDIYKSLKDYEQAFRFLMDEVHSEGALFACIDDAGVRKVLSKHKADKRIITYGKSPDADLKIVSINPHEHGQEIVYEFQGRTYYSHIDSFGEYNALNALAVFGIGLLIGGSEAKLSNIFTGYGGMKRRQEIVGEKNGITIIDDFAHHPTAVKETLKGLRQRFGSRRLIAIFEPRSNTSRSKIYEKEYGAAFSDADMVCISTPPVKKEGYNPDDFMDIDFVKNEIEKGGKEVFCVNGGDEAVFVISSRVKSGDVLVVMSNGAFDGIHRKLLDVL